MRRIALATLLCLTGHIVAASAEQHVIRARAVVRDSAGQEIGTVLFTQARADKNLPTPTVKITVRVEGLAPGLHGFHIHEIGKCTPTFAAAGGHFDPGPNGNSNADTNHPFHMGDLPNLKVNAAGVGHLSATTSRVTLTDGPLSIFDADGSAVIVHLNPDQGITGAAGSGVGGGARAGCGVIERD